MDDEFGAGPQSEPATSDKFATSIHDFAPQEYDDHFRREALIVALTSGLPRKQVATELGIGMSTLNKWVKALGDSASDPDDGLARENERLRRELLRLKEERDLLRKAIHFFAGRDT